MDLNHSNLNRLYSFEKINRFGVTICFLVLQYSTFLHVNAKSNIFCAYL